MWDVQEQRQQSEADETHLISGQSSISKQEDCQCHRLGFAGSCTMFQRPSHRALCSRQADVRWNECWMSITSARHGESSEAETPTGAQAHGHASSLSKIPGGP